MYDVRQFRPAMYMLITAAMLTYCIAIGSPVLLLLTASAVGLNVWLVWTGRFRPLPQLLANALTVLGVAYIVLRIKSNTAAAIINPIGEFVLILQIVKLYEQRGNRDYAQLLVLALLQLVAAVVVTASMLVGLLVIGSMILAMYCLLLFHLKVEADHAKLRMGIDERNVSPMTLRQDQRLLPRSMGRLAGLVIVFSFMFATLVFLFFPRGGGRDLFGMSLRGMSSVGFSERVDLSSVSPIRQNEEVVAYAKLTTADGPVTHGKLYLRGAVFDLYVTDPESRDRLGWRSSREQGTQLLKPVNTPMGLTPFAPVNGELSGAILQEFRFVRPPDTRVIFALGGAFQLDTTGDTQFTYSPDDHALRWEADPRVPVPTRYQVWSVEPMLPPQAAGRTAGGSLWFAASLPLGSPEFDPRIRDYVLTRIGDEAAALAQRVKRTPGLVNDDTTRLASLIEQHFVNNYAYTRDLTDVRSVNDPRDPLIPFLYEWRKGHCEYFASAMTVMLQSVGVPARLVTGYLSTEYNLLSGSWVIRQSQAHAWVEVLTPQGWQTFDPTAVSEGEQVARQADWWKPLRQVVDWLEQMWNNSVVTYDPSAQDSLLNRVEAHMSNTANEASRAIGDTPGFLQNLREWYIGLNPYNISSKIISTAVVLMVMTCVALVVAYVWQRAILHSRAKRIGLGQLAGVEQRRLAIQLGFYDDLLTLLARQKLTRAPHQTPLEFGRSLSHLPHQAYDAVMRLTRIFYKVRYGQAVLQPGQLRRLGRVVDRLQDWLR